ncbi:tyrosine--tRNA ligase [bacterium]|nr:tyrosine--tRNA ligase [bacterium]
MTSAKRDGPPDSPSILLRGIVETLPAGELLARAKKGRLRVKFGADPTAPDLHLGHLVVLRKLRQFQDLGHTVVFIIGDFTARVGDPSGRNTTRPPLAPETIEANARTYLDQIFRVLDRERTEIVRNGDWFGKMGFADILKLAGEQSVAQVLHRRDFKDRIDAGDDVRLHEFLYPLMQGYDSVAVRSDAEIGGSDQKFNLLVGRDLQEKSGQVPQVILTMPLLVGTDGKQKMSKTYGNAIAFRDPPEDMYGKIMSVPDDLLWDYWLLLTDRPESEISAVRAACASGKTNPRDAKAGLAKTLVGFFHGPAAAADAESHFERVFVRKDAPEDIEEFKVSGGDLPGILTAAKLAPSKAEARRLINQGAVSINGVRHTGAAYTPKDGDTLKVGKRRFIKIRVG